MSKARRFFTALVVGFTVGVATVTATFSEEVATRHPIPFNEEADLLEKSQRSQPAHEFDEPRNGLELRKPVATLTSSTTPQKVNKQNGSQQPSAKIPSEPPPEPRTDIHLSGVYPHLTTYGIYSQNGAHFKSGHDECGIGAVVPWAGRLWMVNYAPHMPRGSEHKLFSVSPDLKTMTVHPESVGGTPAGRMIHRESNQLLIAHYLIDADGNIRTISPADMPMRVTAIARHLTDPANMVYYIDMEGAIWEANVHTLAAKKLFEKPVPGWHGKGGYTSQGRLIVSNNGELAVGNYKDVLVGGKSANADEAGVLAEWDGQTWQIVERRQFTDITGPNGISGGSDDNDVVWAIGWDRRSLRLKLLEDGIWHTYLLPKATLNNDARHGWYTEWPRIREITDGRWMMDMHGMFFDFPASFSVGRSGGIRPIGSHLRYIPDFCAWNGQLVLATDETSIQGNHLAGQPQAAPWFGSYEDLTTWGPSSAYGGPLINDSIEAGRPTDPFLVSGFEQRVLHLAVGGRRPDAANFGLRTTDAFQITALPQQLQALPRITVPRGDWRVAAPGYSFQVNADVTVFLAVDGRVGSEMPASWTRTDMRLNWGDRFRDVIYQQDFSAGEIEIPEASRMHEANAYEMPYMAFIKSKSDDVQVTELSTNATLTIPAVPPPPRDALPVTFTVQVDRDGSGQWADLTTLQAADGEYVHRVLPADADMTWMRFVADRHCFATVFLHQTAANHDVYEPSLFAGLADVNSSTVLAGRLYAAKRNRNLRIITSDDRYFDFTKATFEFKADEPDTKLKALLDVKPEFTVDEASVVLKHNGVRLRLPKGDAAFDRPFANGWPRGSREVESERYLANIHGTFYEVPLILNGQPPAFHLIRPVCSHSKQITDFCSWNGLLVLAGVRQDFVADDHIFASPDRDAAVWFGGVDDLWKLGRPTGKGGPWKESSVKAGQPSDAYLMTGYDHKVMELTTDQDAIITVEVDFDHQSGWHVYERIRTTAGATVRHVFPAGFSAHWLRLTSDTNCTATGWLTYDEVNSGAL